MEAELKCHTKSVSSVALTGDNKYIVSGGNDGKVRLWNFQRKTQEAVLDGHADWVLCVAITSDNKHIVSGSHDMTVRIWDLQKSNKKRNCTALSGHTGSVTAVAITSDCLHIVSGSADKTIRVWEFKVKWDENTLQGHVDWVNCVAIVADGMDKNYRTCFQNFRDKMEEELLMRRESGLVERGSEYIVSGSYDHTVRIWNLKEMTQEAVLESHSGWVTCVSVTSDLRYILSASDDKSIRIWDFQKRETVVALNVSCNSIISIVLTKGGRYLVGGLMNKSAKVWKINKMTRRALYRSQATSTV